MFGVPAPSAETTTKPDRWAPTAVMFSTVAPPPGAIPTLTPPGSTGGAQLPVRVSRSRTGSRGDSDPVTVGVPATVQARTSTTTWAAVPTDRRRSMVPVGDRAVVTALAMVRPAVKLTDEVLALPAPGSVGVTASHPAAVGVTTVTLRVTDPTVAGTPVWPVTCRWARPPEGRAPVRPPRPVRVSISRAGEEVAVVPGSVGVPAVVQPARSATRCTVPVPVNRSEMVPSAPTATTARLVMFWPGITFTVDAAGTAVPPG